MFQERKAAELENGMKVICCHQCRQHIWSPEGLGEDRSKEREYSPSPFSSSQTGTSIVLPKGRLSSSSKVFINKTPLVPSFPPHSSQAFGLSRAITQWALFLGLWTQIQLEHEFLWLSNLQATDPLSIIHSLLSSFSHSFLPPSPLPPILSSPSPCLPSFPLPTASHPLPHFSVSFLPPPFLLPLLPSFSQFLIPFLPFSAMPSLCSALSPLPPYLDLSTLLSSFTSFYLSLSLHSFPRPPLLPSSLHSLPPSFPPPLLFSFPPIYLFYCFLHYG